MTKPAKWQLEVLENRSAGRDFRWIHLAAPDGWQSLPGQFVNVRCDAAEEADSTRTIDYADDGPWPSAEGSDLREPLPFVRRPLSISYVGERSAGRPEVVFLLRVVGPGSQRIGACRAGDVLDLVGPLGNGFELDVSEHRAFLVGGGCGIAPLVGVARELVRRGKEVTVFYGCADAGSVPLELRQAAPASGGNTVAIRGAAEFPEASLVLATEDGSAGFHGLVTEAVAAHVSATDGWNGAALFACGPDVMMAAVAALARAHDVARCQVSLENYMGCAVGVCLSCAVQIRSAGPRGWTYQRVCVDGPVFEAAEVIFEAKWEGCKR